MTKNQSQTIRLSLRWLLLAALFVLGLGLIGGIVGAQLVGPRLPVTTDSPDQIVSTVEQVTVSPNKNRSQVLEQGKRSIVLIGQVKGDGISYTGTGVIVTNDGLIATTALVSGEQIVAVDEAGKTFPLAPQGSDPLYGLTYLRLPSPVAVPIELSGVTDMTGNDLLAVSRVPQTQALETHLFHAESYRLPPENNNFPGWQRLLKGTLPVADILESAPVLDEEGKLAGLLFSPQAGFVLPASEIKISLDRLAAGKREFNPFAQAGFDIAYRFSEATAQQPGQFTAVVTSVTPRSAAAIAGIKAGDTISKVGDTSLAWQTPLVSQMGQGLPLTLTLTRQGAERVTTLETPPA
ncbi:MAG: serine protease, partial [Candidatus Andersenbacteria bacterium]|nr:serine protease [Candidatus Andersenbacteria bacterium]